MAGAKREDSVVPRAGGKKSLALAALAVSLIGYFLMGAVYAYFPPDLAREVSKYVPAVAAALFGVLVAGKQKFATWYVRRAWERERKKQISLLTKEIERCEHLSTSHHADPTVAQQYVLRRGRLEQLRFNCENAKLLETPWESGVQPDNAETPNDSDVAELEAAAKRAQQAREQEEERSHERRRR